MVELEVMKATGKGNTPKAQKIAKLLSRVEELHEFNPMLGHRGCRLGIVYPEITRMQARAIFEAAAILPRRRSRSYRRSWYRWSACWLTACLACERKNRLPAFAPD